MKSTIINGHVEHVRLKPVKHRFRYPVYFYCFDLDELLDLDRRLPLFGYNRLYPVSIFDSRYLERGDGSLREKLFRHLKAEGCDAAIRRVLLITSPNYFKRIFNPVSFYYCLSADNSPVCMVVEVSNTFGERHLYLLKERADGSTGFPAVYIAPKSFHVSPFNNMAGTYRFHFSDPGREVSIEIQLIRNGDVILTARLCGESMPLTAKNQLMTLVKNPIVPWKTIPRIHLQALNLFVRKRLPVHDKPVPQSPMTIRKKGPTLFQRLCAKQVNALFGRIRDEGMMVTLPDGGRRYYGKEDAPLQADLVIADHSFYSSLVLKSDIGLGESYVEGIWRSENLAELIRILLRNRNMDKGLPVARLVLALGHLLDRTRHNTLAGSRKNIHRHYDLSNDFFALFLDDSMTYSCAVYKSPDESLAAAQRNKLHQLIEKGRISGRDHVLEIGCGWGAFAVEAVRRTRCRVTAITLSKSQYIHVRERVRQAGLEDRITVLLKDYRRMTGAFDKIVSIEMLEAVGHNYLGSFFKQCDRLLVPNGVVVLQVITIPDQEYDQYMRREDWVRRHIFPGGHLPSLPALCTAMSRHSGLIVEHLENIGPHYVRTLRAWRDRFLDNADKLPQLGFDEIFQKKWLFYLACCEAEFAERELANLQLVLTRTKNLAMNP